MNCLVIGFPMHLKYMHAKIEILAITTHNPFTIFIMSFLFSKEYSCLILLELSL